ncbi:hypothetical protein ILUMI_20213 [Ignelater luminosus]|uniref:Uncharacterized protein n=1 Tax=Ignelater luminosus TaxID=2038154 RepID=A0A8K0FZ51_IGNLU|nr:hypothetical protein ILUMI_20213 [Ignelater luminosus]
MMTTSIKTGAKKEAERRDRSSEEYGLILRRREKAVFGVAAKVGLTTSLFSADAVANLKTEEELEALVDTTQKGSLGEKDDKPRRSRTRGKTGAERRDRPNGGYGRSRKKKGIKTALEFQAKKMKGTSERKSPKRQVGNSVTIRVSEFEKRVTPKIILGLF